jgi:hypothetical protein
MQCIASTNAYFTSCNTADPAVPQAPALVDLLAALQNAAQGINRRLIYVIYIWSSMLTLLHPQCTPCRSAGACLGGTVGCCPKLQKVCPKYPPWIPQKPACCPTSCLPLIEPYGAPPVAALTKYETCCPKERICKKFEAAATDDKLYCCGTVCVPKDSTTRDK